MDRHCKIQLRLCKVNDKPYVNWVFGLFRLRITIDACSLEKSVWNSIFIHLVGQLDSGLERTTPHHWITNKGQKGEIFLNDVWWHHLSFISWCLNASSGMSKLMPPNIIQTSLIHVSRISVYHVYRHCVKLRFKVIMAKGAVGRICPKWPESKGAVGRICPKWPECICKHSFNTVCMWLNAHG